MSYVPSHLAYDKRQYDGWPVGISDEGKAFARQVVLDLFGTHGGRLDLETVRRELFHNVKHPDFGGENPLFDYQYAVADRALRAANARQVWIIGP
jgi:hypothetical protein